jgi:hypothetical protein
MANWNGGDNVTRRGRRLRCFACGGPIEAALEQGGSLRCLDCRDLDRPLQERLYAGGRGSRLSTNLFTRSLGLARRAG